METEQPTKDQIAQAQAVAAFERMLTPDEKSALQACRDLVEDEQLKVRAAQVELARADGDLRALVIRLHRKYRDRMTSPLRPVPPVE